MDDIIQGQVINIDGKCLRGSDDKKLGKQAIYMVSAWAVENEIVLGQRKLDEKSNEITTIPELLKILAISGCIVTIDAMGTQTNIVKTILEANADYVLSVKENQGHLFEDIMTLFAVDQTQNFKYASFEYKKTISKGQGRIDVRECWSTSNPAYLNLIRGSENWAGLQSIAMVISHAQLDTNRQGMCAAISPVCPVMQIEFYRRFANIGLSKINCIGFWMSL